MNKFFMPIGMLCAVLCFAACKHGPEKKEPDVKYVVTSVLQADTATVQEYVCQIRAISHIELRAQERGYLQKIFIDEGQSVRQGQPLFQIQPSLYQAELNKANAEVNYAEVEYRNTKRLADSNVVASGELAMSGAKLNRARAESQLANVHLQFTSMRAPFSGIIDRFQVRLGSLVDEGDLLTTLSDNSQMWVYFNVPEAEYLDYRTQTTRDSAIPVQLMMANSEVFGHDGFVKTIEADFDNETGNIAFRATFPNPEGLLRHGETGNILIRKPFPHALIIPQKATMEIMDKKYVYVVDKANKVELRLINIAAELPDLFIIKDGLAAGDKILLEGVRKVKNGDKIAFDYHEPRAVIAGLKLPTE